MTLTTQTQKPSLLFEPKPDLRFQVREIIPDATNEELGRISFDAEYRSTAQKKYQQYVIKALGLSAPGRTFSSRPA